MSRSAASSAVSSNVSSDGMSNMMPPMATLEVSAAGSAPASIATLPSISPRTVPGKVFAILLGTLVLSLSSWIVVPMIPVPMTMQTLAVALIGAFYGWRLGGLTVVAWLLEGALGLPVFAGGTGGLAHMFGPTAGYLFAFPVGAMLAGWLVQRGWHGGRPLLAFVAMLISNTACLMLGALWLAALIGPAKAMAVGFLPFLLGDVVKSALGAATLVLWHAARQRGRPGSGF